MDLAFARKRLGMTQEQMAKLIGVDQATVCLWEKKKSKPNVKILPKVAEAYRVSVEEILLSGEQAGG